MNAIQTLKSACAMKHFVNFDNLPTGEYIVESMQRVTTPFGERIRVELKDVIVYLPERFTKVLTEEIVAELNTCAMVMIYSGKDPVQNRLLLDFEAVKMGEIDIMVVPPNNDE